MAVISNVPQLPPIPTQLPKTQADWDRMVSTFQNWNQLLLGALQGSPLTATVLPATANSYTVTQGDSQTMIIYSSAVSFTVSPLAVGSIVYLVNAGSGTTGEIQAAGGYGLVKANGAGGSGAPPIQTSPSLAIITVPDTGRAFITGQGIS